MFTGHCERPRAGSKLSIGLKPVDFSIGLMLVDLALSTVLGMKDLF